MIERKLIDKPKQSILLVAVLLMIAACGGSSDSEPPPPPMPLPPPGAVITIENGRLIDSAISGLVYVSGATEGVSGDLGQFQYEVIDGEPQAVSFSFGGIQIGRSSGKSIVTPLDFVADGSLDDSAVLNIGRFLQMLDSDGDLANGIAPSADVIAAVDAMVWEQIDFDAADFENQSALTNLLSFINSVDVKAHVLPTVSQARGHLQGTLSCLSSGVFEGRFAGGDNGHYAVLIQHLRADPIQFGDDIPRPGVASALVYSEDQARLIGVVPQEALAFDNENSFIFGSAVNGAEFTAALEDYAQIVRGQWNNSIEGGSGTFSGSRVAGDFTAIHRLAGGFGDATPFDLFDDTPDNSGGIALDIFADDSVRGVMVSARGDLVALDGGLNGDTVSATSSDGVSINITFDSTGTNPLNTLAGLFGVPGFWGEWQSSGQTGGISGTTCRLN